MYPVMGYLKDEVNQLQNGIRAQRFGLQTGY